MTEVRNSEGNAMGCPEAQSTFASHQAPFPNLLAWAHVPWDGWKPKSKNGWNGKLKRAGRSPYECAVFFRLADYPQIQLSRYALELLQGGLEITDDCVGDHIRCGVSHRSRRYLIKKAGSGKYTVVENCTIRHRTQTFDREKL